MVKGIYRVLKESPTGKQRAPRGVRKQQVFMTLLVGNQGSQASREVRQRGQHLTGCKENKTFE